MQRVVKKIVNFDPNAIPKETKLLINMFLFMNSSDSVNDESNGILAISLGGLKDR
jgi:hypothetical protein